MEHGHNMNKEVDGYVAKNWEDVYNYIIQMKKKPKGIIDKEYRSNRIRKIE